MIDVCGKVTGSTIIACLRTWGRSINDAPVIHFAVKRISILELSMAKVSANGHILEARASWGSVVFAQNQAYMFSSAIGYLHHHFFSLFLKCPQQQSEIFVVSSLTKRKGTLTPQLLDFNQRTKAKEPAVGETLAVLTRALAQGVIPADCVARSAMRQGPSARLASI